MSAELVREWVSKAEQDWLAATRLLALGADLAPDVIAFHAQQTAEKYLKALLVHLRVEPPPVHDMGDLIDLLAVSDPQLEALREDAESLTPFAVRFRYPRLFTTADRAAESVQRAGRIRAFLRTQLALPDPPTPSP